MKRVLVCSDSHGNERALRAAVEQERPDLLLHLGDGAEDLEGLRGTFPELEVRAVRGNCDWGSAAPLLRVTEVEGVRVFMAHGHQFDVKWDPSLLRLRYAALERGAGLALFAHTHSPRLEREAGMLVLNPGAMETGQYAIVTVDGGEVEAELRRLGRMDRMLF